MSLVQDIQSVTTELAPPDLLRYLITERFPGKTIVTASLRARSVVVLKMIADIDPAMPVAFCHPGYVFPESVAYRENLVKLLGLSNVQISRGHETKVPPGDKDHYEHMWAEDPSRPGSVEEMVHLNDALRPYDCWISAVYHFLRPPAVRHRVDREGRLVRVDPLLLWTRQDVARFMRQNRLPFHPRAALRPSAPPGEAAEAPWTYHF
jgi:phosphoadenosine phosphosulfate reductase